jgi:hypothetical protein
MQNKILFERQFKNSIKKIIKEILLENEQDKTEKRKQALEQLKQNKEMYLTNADSISTYINDFIIGLGKKVSQLEEISDQNKDNKDVYNKFITGAKNLEKIKHFRDMFEMIRITKQGFIDIVLGLSNKIGKPEEYPGSIESSIRDQMSKLVSQKRKMETVPEILKRYNISFQNFDDYFGNIFTALDGAITNLENMSSEGATRTTIKIKRDYYKENKKIRRGRFVK